MRKLGVALVLLLTSRFLGAQPLSEIEFSVWSQTNEYRNACSASPLVLDPVLSDIARGHSEEMLARNYFSHDSPNQICQSVRDRLRYGHRFCLTSAENLHKCQGYSFNQLAGVAVQSWVESPGHRRNLANPNFNRVGVGVAVKNGVYVFTQLFSYEPIIIQDLTVVESGGGFKVKISAFVADGPKEGGWFIDGQRRASWVADANGFIATELDLTGPGLLEIGQLVGLRLWDIETTIPIPPPKIHYKHSWLEVLWLDWLS